MTRMQLGCLFYFYFPLFYFRLLIRALPALIPYLSDLFGLWAYKWGNEVFRYLMDGVRHDVDLRRAGRTFLTLHRCSLLLVVMVYSHSSKPEVYCGRGLSPRFLNIDLNHIWRFLAKLSSFYANNCHTEQ